MKKIIFILLFITQYGFSLTPHDRYFCTPNTGGTYTIADIDLRNVYVNTNNYTWYSVNDPTSTPLATTEVIVANTTYYLINNTSTNVHSFTIHIEDTLPAPSLGNNYVDLCEPYVDLLQYQIPYGNDNDLIYWFYTDDNSGTPLGNSDYINNYNNYLYGFLSLGDCAESVEFQYYVHEDLSYYIDGDDPQYFLLADNPTIADLIVTNNWSNTTYWFDEYNLYYVLPIDTPLQNNMYYYAYPEPYNYGNCYIDGFNIQAKLDHNSIRGNIKFDANNNGCDTNDVYVPNVRVTSTNGTNTFTTYSRYGNYTQHIYDVLGDFNTTIDVPSYFDVDPNPLITTFNDYNSSSNQNSFTGDFCLTVNQNAEDVNVDILTSPIRPGFNTSCKLIFENRGTQQTNGTIVFNYDDSKLTFLNTDGTITSQTTNSITFSYSDLDPFEINDISISFNAFQPPITNIDDVVNFNVSITPIANDETPSDNDFSVNRTVIDSFDPNDITCVEGDTIELDDIGKYLHYIIRFENTGSANAINIKVENQLDTKLDWSTFKVISSSHDNRVALKDGAIDFIFSHINLPFTTPESQGYIYYKIKPNSNVVLGAIFENQAHIFFDFNEAIDTNIAQTEVVNVLGTTENTLLNFSVTPVPTKNTLTVKSEEQINSIIIYSYLGKKIKSITNNNTIDISNLENGIYFCKVLDVNGNSGTKKVIKE